MIERDLITDLHVWKDSASRKPLLLRGARQVGKSTIVEIFAGQAFEHFLHVNFELQPDYSACFDDLDPAVICRALSILSQQPIVPGQTLLFLDEIQDCPNAIRALRYFKERMPDLHVIGAGSLLELVLNEADFRMPVGRVTSLYMQPVSFKEFLRTVNPSAVIELEQATVEQPVPHAVHTYLLKQLQLYMMLGGMPEAIATYQSTQNLLSVQAVQSDILTTYEHDFGHYASRVPIDLMRHCFRQVPQFIGQQVKYNKLDSTVRSRVLKAVLEKLHRAYLIQPVFASAATGLPLDATINEKKFKLNFIDVGLVTRVCRLDTALVLNEDMMLLNQGALAEQFVGQELAAYAPNFEAVKLYFWARDGQSTAEIDYLYLHNNTIYPVEVKSGKSGRLRSLNRFMQTHQSVLGIRLSQLPLEREEGLLSVPLYMLSELPRLVG